MVACLLAEQGEDTGYSVLVSALAQRNEFLGDPWGAREAKRALAAATVAAGGKDFDYDLAASVGENTEALEAAGAGGARESGAVNPRKREGIRFRGFDRPRAVGYLAPAFSRG